MSKTYRHVPTYEFEEEMENSKKVKHIDKKHQTVEVTDGVYSHSINENDIVCTTQEQKKVAKKISKKHERNNIQIEE